MLSFAAFAGLVNTSVVLEAALPPSNSSERTAAMEVSVWTVDVLSVACTGWPFAAGTYLLTKAVYFLIEKIRPFCIVSET